MNEANVFERDFTPNYKESWRLFRKNFWKITSGAFLYILAHPFSAWSILLERLKCVFRSTEGEFITPEGITLRHYFHFYIYGCIFIERNLYYPRLIKELRNTICPVVIDVGSNCGFFSQWIGSYQSSAWFFSFEPCREYNIDHRRILTENPLNVTLKEAAVGDICGKVKLEIGNNLFVSEKGREVEMVTIDSQDIPKPAFLIKIDTDGSNLRVLEGAKETIRGAKWVLIEKEIDEKLYEKFFPGWKKYELSPDDLLFENINR